MFKVYDQAQLTYDIHRLGTEQHLGNQNEFCEQDNYFDTLPVQPKKTAIQVNIHGLGVNPFNPADRQHHKFALSTVPDCSGSCNSEDYIIEDKWNTQTHDGSQDWLEGYRMPEDNNSPKQGWDLGTTTREGCYDAATRLKYTVELCALSWNSATQKCYAYHHCKLNFPLQMNGWWYMSMRTPSPGYSKTLSTALQAGRYYVCYKTCDKWMPVPRKNTTFAFRPYFDVVGVRNMSATPMANGQYLGESELYHGQKFSTTFAGIGLNRSDVVAFVSSHEFVTCKNISRLPAKPYSTRTRYYNVVRANYYETTVDDVVLDEGVYHVCYFHRSCVHEVRGTLTVRPAFEFCPVQEGWIAGEVHDFKVHLPSATDVSISDRFVVTKASCSELNWNPADGYIREGVRVNDVNRTTNTAIIKGYTIPLAHRMGASFETMNVCYVALHDKNCGYAWQLLQKCNITNRMRYVDVRTKQTNLLGAQPFPVGTMHLPVNFDTGVVKDLTINLVPYDTNVTCDHPWHWSSSSIRGINITDRSSMQRYTRFDLNVTAFCKPELYRICLYRSNRTKDMAKPCCDRQTLDTLTYDTRQLLRIQGQFRCICTRTMLQRTYRSFTLLDPEGIVPVNSLGGRRDYLRRTTVALDLVGDCANPMYKQIPITQRRDGSYFFESPHAELSQETWQPGNYTICLSGGPSPQGTYQWVKQGDCTLTVVGFNDTETRAFSKNIGHWSTRVNLINAVGVSPGIDRIAISQKLWNRTYCTNNTVTNIPIQRDATSSKPYFMLPPYFPVGKFQICMSFNNGPYTRQVPIEILPQATKVVNRDYFIYTDNTTEMIFGLNWYNYTLTHVGLDRVDRDDIGERPLCGSSKQMAAYNLPLRTVSLFRATQTRYNFPVRVGAMVRTTFTTTTYQAGMVGYVERQVKPLEYAVRFGARSRAVDARHLIGIGQVSNQTYHVGFNVPTALRPGRYAVCLRGKDYYHNNFVDTHLRADILGFDRVHNQITNISMSVRGSRSRLYLDGHWRKLRRVALVWLNDVSADFTHGRYFDVPATSWQTQWGTLSNTWRGRSFRGPWKSGYLNHFPKCGNADQRYEFPVRYDTDTKPYIELYEPKTSDVHAGTWAFCVMFDENTVAKGARDLIGKRIVSRGLDIGWYLMDGAVYTLLEKFNAIENADHPMWKLNATKQYARAKGLYSDSYQTFSLTWIETTAGVIPNLNTTAELEIIGSDSPSEWEISRLRNHERIRLIQCSTNGTCNQDYCQAPPAGVRMYDLGAACTGINTFAINGTVLPGRYMVCIGKFGTYLPPLSPIQV